MSVQRTVHRLQGPLAALVAAAAVLLPAGEARATGFTGGPSVRVTPNTSFDIRWIADFVGTGKVEIFELDFGSAPPLDTA